MSQSVWDQLLLSAPGPRDPVGVSLTQRLDSTPFPPGPTTWPYPLNKIVTTCFYEFTLQAWVPIVFSLIYYIVAHSANHFFVGPKHVAKDYTKGNGILPVSLRYLVIAHNAFLAVYSGWTFYNIVPVVVKFFTLGFQAAGFEGLKVALCSMPVNTVTLAPYAWLFYISKYYEVVDSMILVIKGKTVSNLQSYHHAGALLAMWIAYRYQSQAVWVFVAFNSGVHTAMYSYYFCSAMKWPFPKTLKRNLTTLQILQISSGCFLTNLYWIATLQPAAVVTGLTKMGFNTAIKQPTAFAHSVVHSSTTTPAGLELFQLASQRAASNLPAQCLQSSGASLALHFNTAYLLPLVVLFARFFTRSYVRQQQQSTAKGVQKVKNAEREAEKDLQDADVSKTNGVQSSSVGVNHQNGKASTTKRR
ncbi:unnamed protein product [Sympodiomycopsis kandeliae]